MKMQKMLTALAAASVLAVSGTAGAADKGLSDDMVKIGVLTDMSGVYSAIGGEGAVIAAEMAIEDFGGEVLGKPIELVSADHQNKADLGSTIARKWIDTEGVDMLTELLNSAVALAVQGVASDKKTITINTGAGTTELTSEQCTKYGIHYVYDTYALPTGTATAIVQNGGDTWYFITADYAFGHSLQDNTAAVVKELGGEVLGSVSHPLGTRDFSSYLLQAQASGAKVIGLANAGQDTVNAVKQANSFGIVQRGQQLAGMLIFITDIKSLGLDIAQGLQFTSAFYWDRTEESREWSKRFFERHNAMPTMSQAGVYSAVTQYLKAIEAVGTDDADAVRAKLGEMTIDDMFTDNGKIRADGLMIHDMFLMKAKAPSASEAPWDLIEVASRIPGEKAFMSEADSKCPLLDK